MKNKIGAAIVERITRAHNSGEEFHVIVIMPAVPAFAAISSPMARLVPVPLWSSNVS